LAWLHDLQAGDAIGCTVFPAVGFSSNVVNRQAFIINRGVPQYAQELFHASLIAARHSRLASEEVIACISKSSSFGLSSGPITLELIEMSGFLAPICG
jgi:hypothetical protein